VEYVRVLGDLLAEWLVGPDRHYAVPPIRKRFPSSTILGLGTDAGMVRTVYEHTDARDRVTPIIKIWLNEHVGHWSMLGQIGEPELSLVQVVEKGPLERGPRVRPLQ
jgi:hypothetical protein